MPKRVSLTDTKIKHAKPREKEYNLAAGEGLHLRVKPNGSKLWLFNYFKPYSDRRSNVSLGTYPTTSLKEALEKREQCKGWLSKGIDPKTAKQEKEAQEREALESTFEAVFRRWLAIKENSISPSYRERMVKALELHVLPGMGPIPIGRLTAPLVIDFLSPISEKGRLETVRKLCRWINEVMDFAVNTGLIPANPLSGIRKAFQTPSVNNRPTIKPNELPAFLHDLEQASVTLETRCAIEWLLHTLARPIEGASAKWSEIDFDKATWTIPADRMKMRRPHVVPLSPQALAILELMRPLSSHREYIFPSSRRPRDHINPETANMAIKRMGYGGRLVAHGLRALGSTILNEHGHDPELIEMTLAHMDKNSIRAIYNRAEYLERRRKLMEWWGEYIEAAAIGKTLENKGSKHLRAVK